MTRDVLAVAPDTSLAAVARLLELNGMSGVPVVDEGGQPLGIVMRTDLVTRRSCPTATGGSCTYYRLSSGKPRTLGILLDVHAGPSGVAADVMTRRMCCVDSHADLHTAAERMAEERVHHLFVLEEGRLVGLVAAMDCLRGLEGVRG